MKLATAHVRTHRVTPISTSATTHYLLTGAAKTACGRQRDQRFQIQPIRKWSADWNQVTCTKCLKVKP